MFSDKRHCFRIKTLFRVKDTVSGKSTAVVSRDPTVVSRDPAVVSRDPAVSRCFSQ